MYIFAWSSKDLFMARLEHKQQDQMGCPVTNRWPKLSAMYQEQWRPWDV